MSAKKKNAPAQVSNPVGYGKPPVHSRFRKGKSGNPTGKRKHGEADRAEALIRQEVYRLLTVREGEAVTKMPALQAVIRSQIACAVKGNVAAQRASSNSCRTERLKPEPAGPKVQPTRNSARTGMTSPTKS
jgi:hypothetical protein